MQSKEKLVRTRRFTIYENYILCKEIYACIIKCNNNRDTHELTLHLDEQTHKKNLILVR